MEDSSGSTSINWGSCIDRCNVRVNGEKVVDTPFGCDNSLDDLCKYAAPGLVTKDCKPNNRLIMDIQQALRNIRHSHPLQPDFLNPQQVSQFGVCWTRPVASTDGVMDASSTVPVNVSTPPLLTAAVPSYPPVHGVPSCPPTTTVPPLGSCLSGGAVAGIALGAVAACALVAGGAYVAYRYGRCSNFEGKYTVSERPGLS